jgi:hypothetical protein
MTPMVRWPYLHLMQSYIVKFIKIFEISDQKILNIELTDKTLEAQKRSKLQNKRE